MASATQEIHLAAGTALARAAELATGWSAGMSIAVIGASREGCTHWTCSEIERLLGHPNRVNSLHGLEFPRSVVQAPATLVGDGDDVLDAHSEVASEVDAGLH